MFDFLKYIQPANYYRLIGKMTQAVFTGDSSNEVTSKPYRSKKAFKLDGLYRKLQSGVIPTKGQSRNQLQNEIITDTYDNYVFIRRYFSLIQVLYVFGIRILSLKNPIKEIWGLISVLLRVNRERIQSIQHENWADFKSDILQEKPLVSVIIPTLNRYEYLKDVLADLELQDFTNFEVIVVDQSEPVDQSFYDNWKLNIQLIQQEEKALWLARNTAIKNAKGRFIALTEDDVRMRIDWLSNHLKCLEFFNVEISAGVFHPQTVQTDLKNAAEPLFKLSYQFPTGNALLSRSVFERVGLFDRQFEGERMGDGEFGIRCLLGGFNIISNPMAYIIDVKAPLGGLRQMGSWDALRPKSLFAPRPVPSVLYLIRKYHGSKEAKFYLIKNIPQSYMPYKFKKNRVMRLAYGFIFPFFLPMAMVAVFKSWSLAGEKLKKGARVTKFI